MTRVRRTGSSPGFAVETVCAVLREQGVQIAARTYRRWRTPDRQVASRTVTDVLVLDASHDLRTDAQGNPALASLDGRRKRTALLRRTGITVAHCTVDRLMRQAGMNGERRGRVQRTTLAVKDGVRGADLLNRDFRATAPNRVWVADFTYVRTWAGFVDVAFVVDVFAQRIVGWHAMTTEAGSQYTALRCTEHLALEGIAASIGTVGDAYDNSLMETIIALYKTEAIRQGPLHRGPLMNLSDVELATMAPGRSGSTIGACTRPRGMRTPAEAEAAHYAPTAALQPEPQPV